MQNTGSFCLLSPTLLIHCLTLPLAGLLQVAQAELQKTCSRSTVENPPGGGCQQMCQCRPPPLLPPPPPPPPPPRLSAPSEYPMTTIKIPQCCVEETWWHFLLIILAAVVLFIVVIMCYKAIKRKPLHKDENGTTRAAEYAMTLETA
ncbi:proline-rich membrane anchor 1 isoform X1 [Hyla sarda]|uniref:proline-rich membrane anchor 1 isoform X1 n=1 Tax=Hyla sarda TaxID=327740 RepID=UPI0024C343FA|nr:proline-rich membrane anchor 1 isoform X1 [Hyla sarda]XP_056401705.1 proline-rich membrane anchor 1 isoform X1 [Hyla sarda]